MIITKTPLRISFFGGGTDYPDFYLRHGGEVLSTSIDKYSYILLNNVSIVNDYKYKIAYKQIERSEKIQEINHPIVKICLQLLNVATADITYYGDIPARSGLGAGSAFTVGLLKALYHKYGIDTSNIEIANDAIYIERTMAKENVGDQDQIACSIGGFNHIYFNKDGTHEIQKVDIPESKIKQLNNSLMLFYTGEQRFASEILVEQIEKTKNLDNDKWLLQMKEMVGKAIFILNNSHLDEFGSLLGETWELKKKLSTKVSNSHIDKMYRIGIDNGALGGKLLGAGAGGFLLLYVPVDKQMAVKEAMTNYKELKFNFENTGAEIIYDSES